MSNLTIGELKRQYSTITDVVAKMPYSLVRIILPDGKVVQVNSIEFVFFV